MLEADKLSVSRGGTPLLHDISCAFESGRITAICGPNGAGKSTLLRCLAGLAEPSGGAVTLDREAIGALDPRLRARRIGYLPQHGEVAWNLSVEALVALGRLPHGDRAPGAVAGALAAVDLADFAARPVATLSGGEKARALLARVLAGEPRWILADEPLAALDIAHQRALIGHLRSAAADGAGVVLVLHDLALAMNHADRVLVLDCGALAREGPPEAALSEDIIQKVWNVRARWLGEQPARALSIL